MKGLGHMNNRRRWTCGLLLLAFGTGLAQPLQASCGASSCSVNTQWETQGAWTGAGLRTNLHYTYIDQSQLRSGSRKVTAEGNIGTIDEQHTRNSDLYFAIDYAFNPDWAVSLQLPFIRRDHSHAVNDVTTTYEAWDIAGFGDLRLLARHPLSTSHNTSTGFYFGVKLPSGKINDTNAAGLPAERSLQAGSGTTDTILGVNTYRELDGNATTAFAQAQWQRPIGERDHYAPGQQVSTDIGIRYAMTLTTSVMMQLNLLWKDRDRGSNAEPEETGGRYVYLSPGINHALTKRLQLYGFVQLPLYQYVNGTQLTADKSVVLGLSWK